MPYLEPRQNTWSQRVKVISIAICSSSHVLIDVYLFIDKCGTLHTTLSTSDILNDLSMLSWKFPYECAIYVILELSTKKQKELLITPWKKLFFKIHSKFSCIFRKIMHNYLRNFFGIFRKIVHNYLQKCFCIFRKIMHNYLQKFSSLNWFKLALAIYIWW